MQTQNNKTVATHQIRTDGTTTLQDACLTKLMQEKTAIMATVMLGSAVTGVILYALVSYFFLSGESTSSQISLPYTLRMAAQLVKNHNLTDEKSQKTVLDALKTVYLYNQFQEQTKANLDEAESKKSALEAIAKLKIEEQKNKLAEQIGQLNIQPTDYEAEVKDQAAKTERIKTIAKAINIDLGVINSTIEALKAKK